MKSRDSDNGINALSLSLLYPWSILMVLLIYLLNTFTNRILVIHNMPLKKKLFEKNPQFIHNELNLKKHSKVRLNKY